MKPGHGSPNLPDARGSRLDSWKEIAAYVGRNERTVMRWADERGLPVHRVPGGNRSTVFALSAEIDAWMLGQANEERVSQASIESGSGSREQTNEPTVDDQKQIPHFVRNDNPASDSAARFERADKLNPSRDAASKTKGRRRLSRWAIVGAAVAVITIGVGASALWTTQTARGSAARIESISLNHDTLEAKDEKGRTLWAHHYDKQFARGDFLKMPIAQQPGVIADFFHDGRQEVVASIETKSGPNRTDENLGEVDFFSGEGKELWRYVPGLTVRFGEYEVGSPWEMRDVHVVQSEARSSLFVVESAQTWGNSVVEELEPRTGKNRLRFVNTGSLYIANHLDTNKGMLLVAGGFNNEWDGAALAIWDEKKPFVASPQTAGTRHECKSCAPGAPDYYFVFPRSELNRLTESYDMPVFESQVTSAGLQIAVRDRWSWGKEERVYLLEGQPPFRVKSMRTNTEYQQLHKQWSDEGKLDHRYEDCPELLHPLPVKLWTPAGGWTEIRIPGTTAN